MSNKVFNLNSLFIFDYYCNRAIILNENQFFFIHNVKHNVIIEIKMSFSIGSQRFQKICHKFGSRQIYLYL